MVTVPSSATMTGTARRPLECVSISSRRDGSARMLMYSTEWPCLLNAARAFVV
jgi:hypothetical protein